MLAARQIAQNMEARRLLMAIPSKQLLTTFSRAYSGSGSPYQLNYFNRSKLPANTIIRFVPQQTAWIVERMGKFNRILEPGLAVLMPVLDKIQYVQSLKEVAIEVPSQNSITADNVTLEMDGVLYYKVIDAYKASYGVEDAQYAIIQLAQTTMRSEIGQMRLDSVLRERTLLNANITVSINEAAKDWGIEVLRYELRDIRPPVNVVNSMNQVVEKERQKRANILESEGLKISEINISEAHKQTEILKSEGEMSKKINFAKGDADAVLLKAKADSESIRLVAQAIQETPGGRDAVSLQIAEKYVEAFSKLAKETNTVILPSDLDNLPKMIASGMNIYNSVSPADLAKQVTGKQ